MSSLKKSLTVLPSLLLPAIAVTFGIIFTLFRASHESEKARAIHVIETLLRSDALINKTYAISKTLLDLERLGLVHCAKLSTEADRAHPFYDSTVNLGCEGWIAMEVRPRANLELKAINGHDHHLEFLLPLHVQTYFLEFLIYFILIGVLTVHRQRIKRHQAEAKASADLTLLSTQVAHDIRSPLASLNTVIKLAVALPEDQKSLIQHATQRINDIANQLLKNSSARDYAEEAAENLPIMLLPFIEALISEKRAQFSGQHQVQISSNLAPGFGLFFAGDQIELARALSNLINNAVEATPSGEVCVALRLEDTKACIEIIDNGIGIPANILPSLGKAKVSFGKTGSISGNGLGLSHAFRTAELLGGSLKIDSIVGSGTTVALFLPVATPPAWFLGSIEIRQGQTIITVDDEEGVHASWESRFRAELPYPHYFKHLRAYSKEELHTCLAAGGDDFVVLIDQELPFGRCTGLELIEDLDLAHKATLVTANADPSILSKATELGIKVIPKPLIPLVALQAAASNGTIDAVVIDDDQAILKTWSLFARSRRKTVLCFDSLANCTKKLEAVPLETPIFIDFNLGGGITGTDVANSLYQKGYSKLFISTGYDESSLTVPDFIKGVVGKAPHL